MKKLIPFIVLILGFEAAAQIRIESSNPKSRVSVEIGGNSGYYRDRHYANYIRPYEYLRLSARQEARLYDMLYSLESRRLSQRAYDDMLYRDLRHLLDRRQFSMWENRYYAPRYKSHHNHKSHHHNKGRGKGHNKHHKKDWRDHRGHGSHRR